MNTDLKDILSKIYGDRNPVSAEEHHRNAIFDLKSYLNERGVSAQMQEFEWFGIQGYNLWVPPPNPQENFVLLLAHHDTVPNCPGVDDNGSGMLVLAAIALQKLPYNIGFVFPDFEEGDPRIFKMLHNFNKERNTNYSYNTHYFDINFWKEFKEYLAVNLPDQQSFVGTRQFVKYLEAEGILQNVEVVLDFETVGYTSEQQSQIPGIPLELETGDFLAIAFNHEADKWIQLANQVNYPVTRTVLPVPNKGVSIPDTRRSDHSVFWDLGINAAILTDTANFRNPHYHKESDTTLDWEFLSKVIQYTIKLLENWFKLN